MQNLGFFFDFGWRHIMTIDALDHLLFVLVLSALYSFKDWKRVLILVTAFTVGHSVTLILSGYDLIRVSSDLVEFLIPCTILVTAIANLLQKKVATKALSWNYVLAFFFGLIHGLGFANAIRFMTQNDENLAVNLLGFNLGLEAGQIVVVCGILAACYLAVTKAGLKMVVWVWALSLVSIIFSAKMILERFANI